MRHVILGAIALTLLGGCSTSLQTRPSYIVSPAEEAQVDHGYSLPMLQYDVVIAYKLVSCPQKDAHGKPTVDAQGNPTRLGFKVETIAASDHVAGERFTIDYSALSSPLKVTDFAIEAYTDTGTLKAINASAEDKTGEFIKSAIEFGISGASLMAGNPLPALGTSHSLNDPIGREADELLTRAEMKSELVCSSEAQTLLMAADSTREEIDRIEALIAPDVRELEQISMRASVKLSDPGDAARLITIHNRQLTNVDALAVQQEALVKLEKQLTFVESRDWPTDVFKTQGTIGLSGDLKRWFGKLVVAQPMAKKSNIYDPTLLAELTEARASNWTIERKAAVQAILDETLALQTATLIDGMCPEQALGACLEARLGVHAELLSELGAIPDCKGEPAQYRSACRQSGSGIDARANAAHKGIFFRQPVRARLLLCDRGRTCRNGDRDHLLRTDWDIAPQLGQLRFVPLTNGPFQNNTLSLALREDGTLIKFQYAEKSAILAQALATAASAVTKIDEERVARKKERREALKEYREDLAYERGETAALRTEAAAVRTDEVAQIQYEIDKLTKEKALLDLRFPPAKDDPVVTKEYANETTRLEAEATQLKWKLAIKQTQEALGK